MRHADVATRERARPSGGGQHPGTIRTTLIPAPRLARRVPVEPGVESVRPQAERPHRRPGLHTVLIIGDTVAVLLGFAAVLRLVSVYRTSSSLELAIDCVAVVGVGLLAIRSQQLWVDRIIAVRAIELSRLARAVVLLGLGTICLLYTSPSPRDRTRSRMPSSA